MLPDGLPSSPAAAITVTPSAWNDEITGSPRSIVGSAMNEDVRWEPGAPARSVALRMVVSGASARLPSAPRRRGRLPDDLDDGVLALEVFHAWHAWSSPSLVGVAGRELGGADAAAVAGIAPPPNERIKALTTATVRGWFDTVVLRHDNATDGRAPDAAESLQVARFPRYGDGMDVNVSVTLTLRATVNAESWANRRRRASAIVAELLGVKAALEGFESRTSRLRRRADVRRREVDRLRNVSAPTSTRSRDPRRPGHLRQLQRPERVDHDRQLVEELRADRPLGGRLRAVRQPLGCSEIDPGRCPSPCGPRSCRRCRTALVAVDVVVVIGTGIDSGW